MGKPGKQKLQQQQHGSSKSQQGGDGDPLRRVMKQNIMFNKSKGQHILKNPAIVRAMVDKAGIKSTDTVLEIGPGTGNLTVQLLAKAKKVIAFEIDPRLVAELQKRVMATPLQPKLDILLGDVLRNELPYFDLCVSNLPYQISSPFVFKLIQHGRFRAALVMVQKEFADRLAARPGDKMYSRLSANVQLHCRVSHVMKVSKSNFRPPPKVESAVVRIEPRVPKPPVQAAEFDGLLRVCFARKNKTLQGEFKQKSVLQLLEKNHRTYLAARGMEAPPVDGGATFADLVRQVLTKSGFASSRARSMDEDDLLRLLLAFNKANIRFA